MIGGAERSPLTGSSIQDPLLSPFLANGDRRIGGMTGRGGGMAGTGGLAGVGAPAIGFGLALLVLVLIHLRVHAAVAAQIG